MARELHDTFLQTIHGSKMVVDDAIEKPSDIENMHHVLRRLSVWLNRAMQEGRAALRSLRESTSERNDLREAFRRVTEATWIPGSMSVSLSVIGDARETHPIIRDEIHRLGLEAIRNAAQHFHANRLDIEQRYGHDLTLRISDNGIGVDPTMPSQGREGHYGLQGMRERAGRIGGKLALVSTTKSGTVITLVVPAELVYRTRRRSSVAAL
jgi:signal transduction histidine kinase